MAKFENFTLVLQPSVTEEMTALKLVFLLFAALGSGKGNDLYEYLLNYKYGTMVSDEI